MSERIDISVFTKAICGKLGVTYENVRRLEIHPREAFVEVDVFPDVPKRIDEKGDLMSEVLKFEVST